MNNSTDLTNPTNPEDSQEENTPDSLGPTWEQVAPRIYGWDNEIDGYVLRITHKNGKIKEEHYPEDTGHQVRKRIKVLHAQGKKVLFLSSECQTEI